MLKTTDGMRDSWFVHQLVERVQIRDGVDKSNQEGGQDAQLLLGLETRNDDDGIRLKPTGHSLKRSTYIS